MKPSHLQDATRWPRSSAEPSLRSGNPPPGASLAQMRSAARKWGQRAWAAPALLALLLWLGPISAAPVAAQDLSPAYINAPTNLTATATSSSSIRLNWGDNSDNEVGFRVQRLEGNQWQEVGTVNGGSSTGPRSYNHTGLLPGSTHKYRIEAYNNFIHKSGEPGRAYSNEALATTPSAGSGGGSGGSTAGPVPARPTNLQATALSETEVQLTWTDNSNNETGFEIRGQPWQAGQAFQLNLLTTVPANTTGYTRTGLQRGTRYNFQVCSIAGGGNNCTNYTNVKTPTGPLGPPVPKNLRVTVSRDWPTVQLGWDEGDLERPSNRAYDPDRIADPSDGYRILRAPGIAGSVGGFVEVGRASRTTYSDSLGPDPQSAAYTYRIVAYNAVGENSSGDIRAELPPKANPPTNVRAQASGLSIVIEWNNSANATSFIVYNRQGGAWKGIHSTPSGQSFAHSNLPGNTAQTYKVCAVNGGGSNCSAEVSATTPPNAPSRPTDLKATTLSTTEIRLNWKDASNNTNPTESFIIRRGITGVDFQVIGEVAGVRLGLPVNTASRADLATAGSLSSVAAGDRSSFAYTDTGLQQNTAYRYEVLAKNSSSTSLAAGVEARTASALPPEPTNVRATVESPSSIKIEWQGSPTNLAGYSTQGYRIEQFIPASSSYVRAGETNANTYTFTHTGLNPNTWYRYRVCAFSNAGSTCSTPASATTLPAMGGSAPTSLKVNDLSATSLGLFWEDKSGDETAFRIEVKSGGTFREVGKANANATTYTVTGLQPDTTYELRVCAVTGAGPACSTSATGRTKSN